MKTNLILALLTVLASSLFSAQPAGTFMFQKIGETGALTPVYSTPANSTFYGFNSSGVFGLYSASGGTWGSITGTLSAQTDLNTALGLKLSTATAASTYAPIEGAALTQASINGVGISESNGSFLNITPGTTVTIPGPLGTAAFKDYGTDEFQLLTWAANSNSFPPFSIVTATELGALKRTTVLPVNLGGTNATTASSAINNLLPPQSGNGQKFLRTDGANVSWDFIALGSSVEGNLPVANLGSGIDASAATFWRGDGTWAAAGVTDGDKGDIVVSAAGETWQIDAGVVVNGHLAGGIDAGKITGTAAVLGSNTFTGLQTITQASANAGVLASAGYSLTGTSAVNMLDLAGTWNTSGSPTALKLNLTKTAVGGSAKWLDFQEGGVSKFAIYADNNASIYCGNTLIFTPNFGGSGRLKICGTNGFFFNPNVEMTLPLSAILGWTATATGPGNTSQDTGLSRQSAGVVQVNDGTAGSLRDIALRNLTHSNYIEGTEMTAPAAPAANKGRIYFEDNGSGKTRLMVIFPSGAAQQIAIEP